LKIDKTKQSFANLPIIGCIYESLFRIYASYASVKKKTKMEYTDDLLYKYLDILILEAEIAEPNISNNILYEKYISPTETEKYDFLEFCDKVVLLGNKLSYFKYISKEPNWFELTDKGILAKEKGGHLKYKKFINDKELEKLKPKIIAENYIGGDNYGTQSSNNFSNSPITNNTIANPNIDRKANSLILKFWKLISENKLISSLLLVIILWAVNKIFGINFKI
jgi:hypothetical protein